MAGDAMYAGGDDGAQGPRGWREGTLHQGRLAATHTAGGLGLHRGLRRRAVSSTVVLLIDAGAALLQAGVAHTGGARAVARE